MSNGKVMIIFLTVGLIKKIDKKSLYKMSYFPEPYTRNKNKIKVELILSNYETKSDLKNAAGIDASDFAKKAELASFKPDVDKLDIDTLEKVPRGLNSLKRKVDKLDVDKLKPFSTDLKKLSDIVDKEVIKKDLYEEFVKKVNAIDSSGLVKNQILMLK